jgi:hypothetical protein
MMKKSEIIQQLRDATAASRLAVSEVAHMVDLLTDWGALKAEADPDPANAQVEGAEIAEPAAEPAAEAEEVVYDDSDDDDDEEETETPSRSRRKSAAKTTRRHR